MNPVSLHKDNPPLRIKTVAQLLDVSDKTIRRRIDSAEIKSAKMGGLRVVFRRDFDAYLAKLGQPASAHV